MNKTCFTRLLLEGSDPVSESYLYVKAVWLKNDVTLTLLDATRKCAWTVVIDHDEVNQRSQEQRLEHLSEWVREAFSEGSEKNIFRIESQNSTLTWKRKESETSKIVIHIGEFPALAINPSDAQREFLDASIATISGLSQELAGLTERQDKLMTDLRASRNQMREFKEAKVNLEEQMYAQFLPILNAKQDKIDELQRMLTRLRANGHDVTPTDVGEMEQDQYDSDTDVDEDDSAGPSGAANLPRTRGRSASMNNSQNFLQL